LGISGPCDKNHVFVDGPTSLSANQCDYLSSLNVTEGLMMAKRNTPEGDRLDVLVALVEAWERKHYPMDLPDPVDTIWIRMGCSPANSFPSSAVITACRRR
jgi:hypothetical protein